MLRSRVASRRLALEPLEDRSLMAGNVTASVVGGALRITGDAEANGLTLSYIAATKTHVLTGSDAGGLATTINGHASVQFTGVGKLEAALGAGDDRFEVANAAATDVVIARYFKLDSGDGNDSVVLGRVGNATGATGPLASQLRTGTGIYIQTGGGNDRVEIANAKIGYNFEVAAGDGNDEVLFLNEFTPAGAGVTLFPTRIANHVGIGLGAGDDTLDMQNAIVKGSLRVLDSAGVAHIDLYNLSVTGKVEIGTGDGEDQISLDFVYGKQLIIDSHGGADDVEVEQSQFQMLNIDLGDAFDDLTIRQTRVTKLTKLDGGLGGGDVGFGTGNSLRSLTARNLT